MTEDKSKKSKKGNPEAEMSFLEHLESLRWHIIRAFASIVVVMIVVFLLGDFIFTQIIFAPKYDTFITYRLICGISESLCFGPPEFDLLTREMAEQFLVHLKTSFWLGLIVAFPYVFYEFWKFIKPGLYDKEKSAAKGVVLICSLLFLMGVFFGYFVISPFAITFLANYNVGAINAPTLNSYINYMTMFTLPTGMVFELPIVVYFLSKVGLVTPDFMRQYRKHAFVLILILASIITPPDVITQFLIGFPLYGLYEISIIISKRVYAAAAKEETSLTPAE